MPAGSPAPQEVPDAPVVAAPEKRRVCVNSAEGEPAIGLSLVFYCSDTSARMPGGSGITDEDGCLETQLCASSEALTCARVRDGRARPAQAWVLDPEHSSFDLRLAEPAVVSGELRDPARRPVEAAEIWFEAQDPDRWSAPPFAQMQLRSDAQGAFRLVAARPAPCDPCVRDEEDCELSRRVDEPDAPVAGSLWIRHPEHGLAVVPMRKTWGAMAPIEMDGRRAELRGQLSGLPSGQASGQAAARVKLMLSSSTHRLDRQVTHADAKGRFIFAGLGPGDYALSVFLDGKVVMRRAPVRKGELLSLSLLQGERSDQ